MNIFKIYLLLVSFAGLIMSCECPPKINTNQHIEPTDFANVLFVHAMPDIDSVALISFDQSIAEGLNFDHTKVNYFKIASGLSNLRFDSSRDSSVIYNTMVDLIKDSNYTLFAYGSKSRIDALLLSDEIDSAKTTNVYVRFLHLSPDAPEVIFSLSNNQSNIQLSYTSYTKFTVIQPGKFNLVVKNFSSGSEITKIDSLLFNSGYKYDFVLKGYYTESSNKPIRCEIIALPL